MKNISGDNTRKQLYGAGFETIFDIARLSPLDFVNTIPAMPEKEARKVHRQAKQKARNIKALFRAIQLRHEPVINILSKLNATSDLIPLQDCLTRSLGGGCDFSDLMERTSEYADVTSIQSLFSPGRYAAALYKIAKHLYSTDNNLHIDKRRADLKSLPLSEATMTQEISSLDILLNVLQPAGDELASLTTTFFPMSLPYDDDLAQINSALSAQARSLNGIWNILSDTTIQAMGGTHPQSQKQMPREEKDNSGITFYLKGNEMLWFSHSTTSGDITGAQLIHGNSGKAGEAIVAPLKLSRSDFEQCYYLGVPDGTTTGGTSGKDLTGGFLLGNSSTNSANDGEFAQIASKGGSTSPIKGFHRSIELISVDNGYYLKTDAGYVGVQSSGQTNWEDACSITAPFDNALRVTLCKDSVGTPLDNGTSIYPGVTNTQPSPTAREMLSLTPVCYQLITNPAPTEQDIFSHYGIDGAGVRDVTSLANTLNAVPVFLEKTQLTFNSLLDLTAQHGYSRNGEDDHASGNYLRFGGDGVTFTNVNIYGARYLNGAINDDIANYGNYLWVQNDGATLNFKSDTEVELAGRAEKLIRLAKLTGMTFEELDWVIVNASGCISHHGNQVTLDTSVLNVLAEYIRLRDRYGISAHEFVTFFSSVNPYAKTQEKSLYETAFTSLTNEEAIPFNGTINYLTGTGWYEAHCLETLGVSSDEFTRIGQYCFGNVGSFKMSANTASQIYRFGAIPRMLGLTFAQAEALWVLMGDGPTLLKELGRGLSLLGLDIIRRTEIILHWMADHELSIQHLLGMLSKQWSGTATPEMFNALKNVYESVNETPAARATLTTEQQHKLLRALGAEFNLKRNVMGAVVTWLELSSVGSGSDFTLEIFWNNLHSVFSQASPELEMLQENVQLVVDTQRLSQLVLITQWFTLTEQDLLLFIQPPHWLQANITRVPTPDLLLLLTLSRFKQWQMQVTVSRDEAMRIFDQLNDEAQTSDGAATLIGRLHDADSGTVKKMSTLLFGDAIWPTSFDTLWQLLTWLKTGKSLSVGSDTLSALQTMMLSDPAAEEPALLTFVAQNITAGLHGINQETKGK